MKKLIVLIFTFVTAAGIAFFVWNANETKKAQSSNPTPQSVSTNTAPVQKEQTNSNESPSAANGIYADYNEEKFSSESADTRRILFFHAPWCPQCRALDKELTSNTLPKNLIIYKVDYDTNQALRQKYGVTLQTTFIEVAADGSLKQKFVAYQSPTYASLQAGLLSK